MPKTLRPRRNGNLRFERPWEARVFGLALALSKQGYFEWEDFRQNLIKAIGEWEQQNPNTNDGWDYYDRWLLALERMVLESSLAVMESGQAFASPLVEHGILASPPMPRRPWAFISRRSRPPLAI